MWRSFGAEVTIVEALPRLVPLEDESSSKLLERAFRKRNIAFKTGVKFTGATQSDSGVTVSPTVQQTSARSALAFLAIAPMLWAALRYQQRDTATAALVLSCFAIWGTLANSGPFVRSSLNDSFLLVLTFVISAAIPSLVLSADVAIRRRARERPPRACSHVRKGGAMVKVIRRLRKFPLAGFLS